MTPRRRLLEVSTLVILMALLAYLALVADNRRHTYYSGSSSSAPRKPSSIRIEAPFERLTVSVKTAAQWGDASMPVARRHVRGWLSEHARVARSGRVTITYHWPAQSVAAITDAVRARIGTVRLTPKVTSVSIALPAIRQAYRNNCETAALASLLDSVSQQQLQRELPIASPYVRSNSAGGVLWGDPEQGFVGNVRGGGYGVYDEPLLKLAQRYQPSALNLTGSPLRSVVGALRSGRAVIAWIALGPSEPTSWVTPAGRRISANWAEHTIVLYGWEPGRFSYIDPWDGQRKTISLDSFAAIWETLGRRAIAGQPYI